MLEGFEENLKSLCKQFARKEDKYEIVLSEENYPRFQNLLKLNGMTYVVRHSGTNSKGNGRLLWNSWMIPFFKTPFSVEKSSSWQCSNGPRYYAGKSRKTTPSSLQDSHSMNISDIKPIKTRRRKESKKVGCKAIMRVFIIKTYPEYRVKGIKNIKNEKASAMKLLKKTLETNPTSVVTETLYHISFSLPDVHCHSVLTNFTGQQLDPALKTEIRNLVESGVTNIQTIKALLCKWVRNNIGDVDNSSRAYWPTKKTIRNYVMKYAPRAKNERIKMKKSDSKIKISYNKKRPVEKKHNYESCNVPMTMNGSSYIEIEVSNSDSPELESNGNDHQYQITCSSSEPFDSFEAVSNSEIRQIAKAIYDRSHILPDNCADSMLRDKLMEVYHLMNNYIDHNPLS